MRVSEVLKLVRERESENQQAFADFMQTCTNESIRKLLASLLDLSEQHVHELQGIMEEGISREVMNVDIAFSMNDFRVPAATASTSVSVLESSVKRLTELENIYRKLCLEINATSSCEAFTHFADEIKRNLILVKNRYDLEQLMSS